MKTDVHKVINFAGRYKKALVIGGISFLAFMGVLVVGAGVLVYKTAGLATQEIKTWKAENGLPAISLPKPGFVEGVVLGVASGWLERSLAGPEVQSVKDGLSCFDALGGPSPSDVVTYVEGHTSSQQFRERLTGLKERLATSPATTTGPAACANWILNS